ncbi:MAG TPA: MGMT family protein [Alphaproteobacteria bacterium]|jgi:methylated-DNA-protein-cysteine methyltransferase-like protein|nr:MGMT family protein [Alphaproteobacteria bacterium]
MSKFKDSVIKIVNLIPHGKVVSYGQVALYLGMPRAARQVGWILNGLEDEFPVPWWRVVNNKGYLSIKGSMYTAQDQKELLVKEGIEVQEDFTFDIEKYRFRPSDKFIKKLELDPGYLEMIADKIPYSKSFHS